MSQCDIALTLYQRVSCFTHTLQLIVHLHDALPHMKSTISRAHKLVSKMNKSTKATERLIKKSGKKLINACPTRWSSTFLMISHLFEMKSSLISVCEKLGWNALTLSNLQWRQLEMTEKLLKPFAQYTTLISGKEHTTISLVIPILLELEMHLQDEVCKYT